jgi:hypothetical protein
MNLENQPPVNVFVESTSDCILINEHCYIKSPSETGPMTHSSEGFLELENCFDCESSSKSLTEASTSLININTCITLKNSFSFLSRDESSFGFINIFNGRDTSFYEILIQSEDEISMLTTSVGSTSAAVRLGGSSVFKVGSIQYKAELNKTDDGDFLICLTKDPFNKTCNTFLSFSNVDYDIDHYNTNEQSVHIFRLVLQSKTQGELITDIAFTSAEQLRLRLNSFFLEHITNNEIDIFADVVTSVTDAKYGEKTLVVVQFWKPNGIINKNDLSLFSVDLEGVASKIDNTLQAEGNSRIDVSSDFDLDGLVNLYDEITFGKGQRPNCVFEIPKESSNSDVVSNFHFGDDLYLKFNYESEHEYFSNLNPTISESLRSIANQVAYDFSKQNHGVFCDFKDDSIKNLSTLEVWSPCSFLPLEVCELFISKSIISVRSTSFKDEKYSDDMTGDYFTDGGAFSLVSANPTESIFWGQYTKTGDIYNEKPIYSNGPPLEDLGAPRVMVSWSRITNEWILGDIMDPSTTYSLGKGPAPFSTSPITEDDLVFSPGFNGLPTFSNSKGYFIFAEKISLNEIDITPTFYITDTPYSKSGGAIKISQDVDFAKKLCKYHLPLWDQ